MVIVLLILIIAGAVNVYKKYHDGKKALLIFPDIDTVKVIYTNENAQAISNLSSWTKFTGFKQQIHLTVTDEELWIHNGGKNGMFLLEFDLLHKINLRMIKNVVVKNNLVSIQFENTERKNNDVVIRTRFQKDFLTALNFQE